MKPTNRPNKEMYARDSYAIVQRQIEAEQNENALLFYDATDDILRNEELPKPTKCPNCYSWAQLERDGELFIGQCTNCGEQIVEDETSPNEPDEQPDEEPEYDIDGTDLVIKSKKFRDKRTGEIVERFNILDIEYMDEVQE